MVEVFDAVHGNLIQAFIDKNQVQIKSSQWNTIKNHTNFKVPWIKSHLIFNFNFIDSIFRWYIQFKWYNQRTFLLLLPWFIIKKRYLFEWTTGLTQKGISWQSFLQDSKSCWFFEIKFRKIILKWVSRILTVVREPIILGRFWPL